MGREGTHSPEGVVHTHLGREGILVGFLVDQSWTDEANEAPHRGPRQAQDGLH
jgi:hypothetical protein